MKKFFISIFLLSFCFLMVGCFKDKKEEEISNLKQQVTELETMNNGLIEENRELKQQIKYFEKVYNASAPSPSKTKNHSGIYDSIFNK